MKRFQTALIVSALGLLSVVLTGCDAALINPKGPIGLAERDLIYLSVGLMLIVVLPAMFMAVYFFLKYRETQGAEYEPSFTHSSKIEWVVWMVPVIIIVILATITWITTHRLDPYKPLEHENPPITIQVISLDWKWLFIYPEQGIASVSEMAFPINTPIAFKVTSDTVMNSFFIPRLGTQIYTMAGMQTQLHLIADKPGNYKGISSGYSGHGFSDMKFTAIATETPEDFQKWVQKVKASPNKLSSEADFNKLAKPSYGYPVTYYSSVKPNLFKETMDKYMAHDHHGAENESGTSHASEKGAAGHQKNSQADAMHHTGGH
ncbi:MAG: ubiquinol oxidase subunit II [Cellvibrionales bacterium]|nr:ubiquinol oxidase subunit II [Cellvibrionales bacterium]